MQGECRDHRQWTKKQEEDGFKHRLKLSKLNPNNILHRLITVDNMWIPHYTFECESNPQSVQCLGLDKSKKITQNATINWTFFFVSIRRNAKGSSTTSKKLLKTNIMRYSYTVERQKETIFGRQKSPLPSRQFIGLHIQQSRNCPFIYYTLQI